jgi:lipopolysaccharide export system protein LptA
MKNFFSVFSAVLLCAAFAAAADAPAAKKNGKAKKKPVYPAMIGGVVQSDTWDMRRLKGEEEFTGHVFYRNPQYRVKSDWGLYQRLVGIVTLHGNIEGIRYWKDGSISRSYADNAQYFMQDNSAKLYPKQGEKVRLYQDDPAHGAWHTLSDTAFFAGRSELVTLTGDVSIVGSSSTARCDTAVYDYKSTLFDMQGRPLITGRSQDYEFAVNGDSAAASGFFTDFNVNGGVRGWLRTTSGSSLENGTESAEH